MLTATNVPAAPPIAPAAPLRQLCELPGPRGLPLFGNILQVRPSRIHQDFEHWCRRHGSLFRVRFGPTTILAVADHEAVNAILRERPDGFRRPAVTAAVSLEMGGLPGLFMAEGTDWRRQRRMVMQGFAPGAIKAYFPSLLTVAQRLQRRWERAADTGRDIDLDDDLKRYTVDIIAGLAFGSEVNTLEAGEDVIQQHLDQILPALARRSLAWFPYWRYLRLPADRRLERSVAAVNTAIESLIDAARARLEREPARRERPGNLLEAMLAAPHHDGEAAHHDDVAGNVLNMLLAGEDTTAHSLSWLIYLLQRQPHALAKAREEVRRLAPDSAAFDIAQMDSLDYLGACIEEAMRLKPVAPFMPFEAVRDCVVGDVAVPAGTMIWCVMRHDSVAEHYFPDAGAFRPERWLDGGSEASKRISTPFGSGPRTCPGRYLALLEIKIAMAMLLGRFDIGAVATPDGKAARENMGFVMTPHALRMRLRRTSPSP